MRLRTYVTDPAFCEPVLEVQGEVFGDIRPAATIVVVSALLKPEMKVEIEADARIDAARVTFVRRESGPSEKAAAAEQPPRQGVRRPS